MYMYIYLLVYNVHYNHVYISKGFSSLKNTPIIKITQRNCSVFQPLPGVWYSTQESNTVGAGNGVLIGQLYHSSHGLGEGFPHLWHHPSTGQLLHTEDRSDHKDSLWKLTIIIKQLIKHYTT